MLERDYESADCPLVPTETSPIDAKLALARRIRRCRPHHIIDQTGVERRDVAIYALSDPREGEMVRYVGQTRDPQSRFSQHINAARPWLPGELPWWIKRPELRPLYTWIRSLYCDDGRLPIMFVVGWTTAELARSDERRFIRAYLADGLPLLNCEAEIVRARQVPLLTDVKSRIQMRASERQP